MQVDPPPEEAPIFEPFVELAALAVDDQTRPPRPPRPRRGLPQRRADGEGDLDARRHQRRPGDPRHRRRLEGGRVARLRLRLPAGRRAAGDPRRPPRDHHAGCSRPGRATWEGAHAHVRDAIHEPKGLQQPRIPILVGGNGPKVTWRLAARFADELNLDALTPAEVEAALPVIATAARRSGATRRRLAVSVHIWGEAGRRPARAGAAPAVPRLRGARAQPDHRPGLRARRATRTRSTTSSRTASRSGSCATSRRLGAWP